MGAERNFSIYNPDAGGVAEDASLCCGLAFFLLNIFYRFYGFVILSWKIKRWMMMCNTLTH